MQNEIKAIEIQGLTKIFGKTPAVRNLDFFVEQGQCMALLGPNGAGKTTTINVLLGLVIPTSGTIKVFDKDLIGNTKEIKKRIGVAPQLDNLDPDLSVIENLVTYASYFKIPKRHAMERAEELLRFLALEARHDEVIQNLSGGQRRRLIIARALINRPRLLILDEPIIGLDPQARHLIWERLEALKAKGTTMLITSHYMEEVSRLADRVLIMEKGRKVLEGSPQEMVARHIGEYVYEIIEDTNELSQLEKDLSHCNARIERHGKRFYIYTKGTCLEAEKIGMRYSHVIKRPANLEDLFLHFTGKKLTENREHA